MEEEFCSVDIQARQKYFPWLKIFLEKFLKTFPNYCVEDLLLYLLENVDNEVNALALEPSKKRQKALFETVSDLFLHLWWRIHWKEKKTWKKYWKKDCLDAYSCDGHTRYYAKLLYYVIHLGLLLSKGAPESPWVNRILQAVKCLPVCDDIVYSSLLMLKKIKKYRDSYIAVLRHVLLTGAIKCITEPVVYMKVMILFKKLKLCMKDNEEKIDFVLAASKFEAPLGFSPWLSSLNLKIKHLERKSLIQLLLHKESSNDVFEKLQMFVADFEFKQTGGCLRKDKTKDKNSNTRFKKNSLIKNRQAKNKKKEKSNLKDKSQSNFKIKDKTLYESEKLSKIKEKKQAKRLKKKIMMAERNGHSLVLNKNQHNPSDGLKLQHSSVQLDPLSIKNYFMTERIGKECQVFSLSNDDKTITENGVGVEGILNKNASCSNDKFYLLGKRCKSPGKQRKKFKLVHNFSPLKNTENLKKIIPDSKTLCDISESDSLLNAPETSSMDIFQDSPINFKYSPKKKSELPSNHIELSKMHSSPKVLAACDNNNAENSKFIEQMGFGDFNESLLIQTANVVNSFQSNETVKTHTKSTVHHEERNAMISCRESHHDLSETPHVSLVDIRKVYPPDVCNSLLELRSLNTSLTSLNSIALNKGISESNIVGVDDAVCNSDSPLVNLLTPLSLGNINTNYKAQTSPDESDIELCNNAVDNCNKNDHIQNKMIINSYPEINAQSVNQQCNDFNFVLNLSKDAAQQFQIDHQNSNNNKCTVNQVLSSIESESSTIAKTPILNEMHASVKNSGKVSGNEYALFNGESELHRNMNINLDGQNSHSYVIDCKIANESNDTVHSGPKFRNSDISSIKVIINLNNKRPDVSVHSSNDHMFGSIESHSKVLVSSTSENIFSSDPNSSKKISLPLSSSTPKVSWHKNDSIGANNTNVCHTEITSFQPEKETFPYSTDSISTPHPKQNRSVPSKENIQNFPSKPICLSSPQKRVSNILPKNNSIVESGFRTPHTSDCDSEYAFENISLFSSFETNVPVENGVSQSNLPQNNSNTQVIQSHQNRFSNASSTSDFSSTSLNLAETILVNNDSPSKEPLYRNSRTDIYSEVSEDDVSISTMGLISEEDSDHTLKKSTDCDTSPESKNKIVNCSSKSRSKGRKNNTLSTKSKTAVNRKVDQRSKKLCSSKLNCDHNDVLKELSATKPSTSISVNRVKTGKSSKSSAIEVNSESCGYNLRSRRRIVQPSKFIDYII